LAGGKSERMQDDKGPKALRMLGGKYVVDYSIVTFRPIVENIIVVFNWDVALEDLQTGVVYTAAGETRDESLRNGIRCMLKHFPKTSLFYVHDACRPFVKPDLIKRLHQAKICENSQDYAIIAPVLRPTDTISKDKVPLRRKGLWRVQTPVLCHRYVTRFVDDHANADEHSITSWVRPDQVDYIDGDRANFKITEPFDWRVAQLLVENGDD